MLNDLQIVSDLICIILFLQMKKLLTFGQDHIIVGGELEPTLTDSKLIEFVATYIIMVKVSFVAIWVNSVRVSTSLKDAQMAGRIRKENQNSREAEKRKSPKINVKE